MGFKPIFTLELKLGFKRGFKLVCNLEIKLGFHLKIKLAFSPRLNLGSLCHKTVTIGFVTPSEPSDWCADPKMLYYQWLC